MRPSEIRELLQFRAPLARRADRALARSHDIEDLRRVANRRWPSGVRGYVEGGADGELSLRRNREAYARRCLVPSALHDVSDVDLSTGLLGRRSALPLVLGPTGYTRMMHRHGEHAVAAAAERSGVPYTVATMSTVRLEDIPSGGDLWFQLYMWRDRGLVDDLVDRAAAAGYHALMLTVDTAVTGQRLRDARTGFTLPPRLSPGAVLDMARHPGWCAGLLRREAITFANVPPELAARSESVMDFAARQFDASVTWDDVARLRARWPGPIVLKGLLDPVDVVRAVDAGVDAVVLSNHGGRQLDQTVAPLDVLPEAREQVGESLQLFVDSGIRRGTDVAIALALGADAALIGRPYLYGLGAAGEEGVEAAIRILGTELRRAVQLLGVTSIEQLRDQGPQLVRTACHVPSEATPVRSVLR